MDDAPLPLRFEPWYREQHPRVLAALTVMAGDAELAADVTAEALAIAYERWDRVAAMASPGGWLHQVAVNLMRRRLRRRTTERVLLGRHREPVPPPQLALEVWDAVRGLPPQQRTAIALRYLLDLSQAEIATAMGIAPGTVSATLHAARRRLEPLLHADGPDQEVRSARSR